MGASGQGNPDLFCETSPKTVVRDGVPVTPTTHAISCMGPQAGAFVRVREYAHIRLGHLHRRMPARVKESEADLDAAKDRFVQLSSGRRWLLAGNGGWAKGLAPERFDCLTHWPFHLDTAASGESADQAKFDD